MKNLFETASNIAATAVNIAKSLPEGLNNALVKSSRDRILEMASLLKKSDETRLKSTAPNWFYKERAKKWNLPDYSIPENLKSDFQRYSSTFGREIVIKEPVSYAELMRNTDVNYRRKTGRE